jgi:rhamnose utilization protein RhaD (predicted bifunctional aldolase and dehydrogenase)
VRTKVKPLWVDFNPQTEAAEDLKARIREDVIQYRQEYQEYFSRNKSRSIEGSAPMFDPSLGA